MVTGHLLRRHGDYLREWQESPVWSVASVFFTESFIYIIKNLGCIGIKDVIVPNLKQHESNSGNIHWTLYLPSFQVHPPTPGPRDILHSRMDPSLTDFVSSFPSSMFIWVICNITVSDHLLFIASQVRVFKSLVRSNFEVHKSQSLIQFTR